MPKIITGSSAGSISASFIATKTKEELKLYENMYNINYSAFNNHEQHTLCYRIKRFLKEGVLLNRNDLS